jgi:hypothetical protein
MTVIGCGGGKPNADSLVATPSASELVSICCEHATDAKEEIRVAENRIGRRKRRMAQDLVGFKGRNERTPIRKRGQELTA